MMKQIARSAVLGAALLVVPSAAHAAPATNHRPTIQQMLQTFHTRIVQGVQAGTITKPELTRLRTHLTAFRTHLATLRQQHTQLTAADRQQLQQQLRSIGGQIYRAKHDGK
jgi:multidrug resistance efflux pump